MTLRLKVVSAIDLTGCFPNADVIHGTFYSCQASTASRSQRPPRPRPRAPAPVSERQQPGFRARPHGGCQAGRASAHASSVKAEIYNRDFAPSRLRVSR